jgi:CRISPR-associated protein Csm4
VIDRLSNTTTEGGLFYTHETFIGEKSGLFFLIDIKDKRYENLLNASLRFAEDRGIGGDVSVGKGQFDIELLTEAEIIHEPKNPDSFTNLSLYYPCDDEIPFFKQHEEKTWYNLIGKKGKIESAFVSTKDIWKESIQMFEEGSTFPLISDRELYGKNPIVKEKPFKIQHYGFALPVKMRM